MKKLISLIKACMTSDMSIFKIKQKKDSNKKKTGLMIAIAFFFMMSIWSYANMFFEKMAPLHLQEIVLSIFVFLVSIIVIGEGIYKTGPLLFNCKDDQLLLSLPIKRSTIFFVRVFKFYVFEVLFNALFIIPLIIAYIRWADTISYTFFITSAIMLLILPVIPIVLSCIIGTITSSIASRFKYKNIAQIITTTFLLIGIFYVSLNLDGFFNYLTKHATTLNDFITKIYYPAEVYAKLSTNFNIIDLLIFIGINIVLLISTILILSKFYFKINSRLKKVTTTEKVNINRLTIKKKAITHSLIKKEFSTFFNTPVFIINAGFGLVLFIVVAIGISIKFNDFVPILTDKDKFNIAKDIIYNNLSLLVFLLIAMAGFMTSITNSVISLEGKNINIVKSLPIKTKTILMSKIYSSLIITTPPILIGDIILFTRFKMKIIEICLLLVLSILIPLISHFVGLIVNLKYPKLDWENTAEVVKQSTSSFVSVMIGIILLVANAMIIAKIVGKMNSTLILLLAVFLYLIVNIILYVYLINKSTKEFNQLSV